MLLHLLRVVRSPQNFVLRAVITCNQRKQKKVFVICACFVFQRNDRIARSALFQIDHDTCAAGIILAHFSRCQLVKRINVLRNRSHIAALGINTVEVDRCSNQGIRRVQQHLLHIGIHRNLQIIFHIDMITLCRAGKAARAVLQGKEGADLFARFVFIIDRCAHGHPCPVGILHGCRRHGFCRLVDFDKVAVARHRHFVPISAQRAG